MKKAALLITFVILSNITNAQWVQTNGPYGGTLTCLAINSNGNIFAGTPIGLFLSTDSGNNWVQLENLLTSNYASTIAINSSDVIFVGTGVTNELFRSTNNGNSWTLINDGLGGTVSTIAINSSGVIFVGTSSGGVYRSTNNGDNWTSASNGLTYSQVVCFAINSNGDLFAGTYNYVYGWSAMNRSTDNGDNWTQIGFPSNASFIAINKSNGYIFAGGYIWPGYKIYRSTDNGDNWAETGVGYGNPIYTLIVNSLGHVFASTGTGVYRSTNNGNTWLQTGMTSSNVVRFAINSSDHIYAGTSGNGIFLSTDNGSNWTKLGLRNSYVNSLVSNNYEDIFAGTWGDGAFRSTDAGNNWTQINTGGLENKYINAFTVKSNGYIFAGTFGAGVFVSINNGSNWTSVNNGLTDLYIYSLANSGDNIFAGTNSSGIFLSTDNGSNWATVNNGLIVSGAIMSLIKSGDNIFAGTNGNGVFLSTDNGSSWTAVNYGLTNSNVYSLALSGDKIFAGTWGGGIFLSTNNGISWTEVNNGLSNPNIISISISGDNIFAGTWGGGIFLSTNNGSDWIQASEGLTNYITRSLIINSASGYIFLGTDGSGVWRRPLSEMIEENAYVLKRTVNGTTETYSLNNHAWSFQNNADMWPQTWWEQFDYSQPQYPIAWANFSSERFPDWPLFAEAYGEPQCYWNPPPGIIIYKYFATKYWINLSNQKFNPNTNQWYYWGGSCFGFAISSFLFFDELLSLDSVFPGNPTLFDVPALDDSRKLVNLYWTYVTGDEHHSYLNQNYEKSPVQTLIEIKNMFIDILRDDRVLYFNHQNGSGAHAVNPYRVGVGQSIDTIYIYDNNAPEEERKIYVNKIDSTWDYPDMPGWGGSKGLFLMEPASNYLTNPILPNQLPPKERYISNKLVDNNFIEIYNSFNSDITIKNTSGDSIGFKISDGNIYSNFQDGMPIIPITGNEHPPIGYYIPNDNYSLELSNVQDTSVYVSFFNDSLAFSINRNNSNQSDVENFNFESSNHKLEILNSDNKTKIYDIGVIIAGEESEKVLEVNNLVMLWNDSLKFYPEENENLKVENLGGGKSYNLNVKLASASSESIFEHSNISLIANSSHTIIPTWQDLDSVTIYIDDGNDGTIDDSINIGNQFTGLNDEVGTIPTEFKLFQNYPNPFNSSSIIKYSIPKFSQVTLKIFNTLGEELETLINEEKPAGTYEIEFNAVNHSSGVYFYRLQAGSYVESKKMILLK